MPRFEEAERSPRPRRGSNASPRGPKPSAGYCFRPGIRTCNSLVDAGAGALVVAALDGPAPTAFRTLTPGFVPTVGLTAPGGGLVGGGALAGAGALLLATCGALLGASVLPISREVVLACVVGVPAGAFWIRLLCTAEVPGVLPTICCGAPITVPGVVDFGFFRASR